MRWLLAVIVASGGCDLVFRLDHLNDPPPDAEIDGAPFVPPPDADTTSWPTNGNVVRQPCLAITDEDGDGFVNDCDVCPLDADDQTDTDHDGIGDVCDPHPKFAIERLAYFNGMNGAAVPGTTIQNAGNWTISNGALHQAGGITTRSLFVLEDGPWRAPVIEMRSAFTGRNGTALNWYGGVMMFAEAAPATLNPDEINCRTRYTAGADLLELSRVRKTVSIELARQTFTTGTEPTTYFFGAARLGETAFCRADRGTAPPSQMPYKTLLSIDDTDPEMVHVGFWTIAMRMDIKAIAIYESAWPP